MSYQIIGFAAGLITSVGFIPQVYKALRTKKVEDISWLQPLVLSVGIFLWLIYGLILNDQAIILANAFALCCNILLLSLKIIYQKK
jgi:MtN3 and saliva related transmembrane protein